MTSEPGSTRNVALFLRNSRAFNSTTGESSVFDLVRKILLCSPESGLSWDAPHKSGLLPRLSDEPVGSLNSLEVLVKSI